VPKAQPKQQQADTTSKNSFAKFGQDYKQKVGLKYINELDKDHIRLLAKVSLLG